MGYINAEEILPQELIADIQRHVDGVAIYIPRKADHRRAWGCSTQYQAELAVRNQKIGREYCKGCSVSAVADTYHLSAKTIQRILREMK